MDGRGASWGDRESYENDQGCGDGLRFGVELGMAGHGEGATRWQFGAGASGWFGRWLGTDWRRYGSDERGHA